MHIIVKACFLLAAISAAVAVALVTGALFGFYEYVSITQAARMAIYVLIFSVTAGVVGLTLSLTRQKSG